MRYNGTNYPNDKEPVFFTTSVLKYIESKVTADELLMLDWLIFRQRQFGCKEFFYTKEKLYAEIKKSRHIVDKLLKKFIDLGVLYTSSGVKDKATTTFFTFKFGEMLKHLSKFIEPDTQTFKGYEEMLTACAKKQAEVLSKDKEQPITQASEDMTDWQCVLKTMQNVLGDLTGSQISNKIDFNEQSLLTELAKRYDIQDVANACVMYANDNCGVLPNNPIVSFLKRDKQGKFYVFEKCLSEYNHTYK